MKIFDAHAHCFPSRIAPRTIEALSQAASIRGYHDGSFSGLKAYEAQGKADGFLLLPIATKPSSVRSINEWVAAKAGGGVLAFGSIHPDGEDIEGDLNHIVEMGLRGVKLHPEYQNFFVDEERMLPIYEAIFAHKLPICFHAGADLGFPPPIHGDARRIAHVARMFPEGRVIAAHMGGLFQLNEAMDSMVGLPNVWMDTSFASERMRPEDIVRLVRAHGADRFLFGTDAPWADFATARDAVALSGLAQEELDAIFWDNAAALFGLA